MGIQRLNFSKRSRPGAKGHFFVVLLVALLALVLVPVVSGTSVTEAVAQEKKKRGFRLFDRIFRPKKPRNNQHKEIKVRRAKPSKSRTASRRGTNGRATARGAVQQPQAVSADKNEDARVILVTGDFLAAGLARGLKQSYAENPTVIIVDRSMPSSGIVRDDHFDWQARSKELLEAEKRIDLVTILIGANDSQPIRSGGKPAMSVQSDEWIAAYKERAAKLSSVFTERNIPVVWSGVPPMQKSSLTATIAVINDLQSQAAEGNPLVNHVDIWNGFADENGRFVATGPDEKGQVRRLRTSDGINLASAGRTKIAFFARQVIDQVLGEGPTAFAALRTAPDGLTDSGPETRIQPVRPEVWEVILTDDTKLAGSVLAGETASVPKLEARQNDAEAEIAQRRLRDGLPPVARKGRVDDFGSRTASDLPRL